jgi:Ca2+-binding RTX toxin-like protein
VRPGGGVINGPASDSMLLQKNVALIDGLQALLGQAALLDPEAIVFDPNNGADILIGGQGSDRFIGKAGNDLIDGDAWLNVRISIRSATNPNVEIRTVDSMNAIKAEMLAGTINPGQLRIVREIISDPLASAADVDTAIYSDLRASYDVTLNGDGTWTVAHVRGTATDGTDKIRNIEQLQFSDQVMNLTGAPSIADTSPTEGRALLASPGNLLAFNNVPASAVSYQWQSGSGATFTNIAGATGASFTPTQAQVGTQLRVIASFLDQFGVPRAVASQATGGVGDLVTGDAADNILTGTMFNDELQGLGGNDVLNGGFGVDLMAGGAGDDTYVVDNVGDSVVELAGEGNDTVRTSLASYVLGDEVENLTFLGTGNFVGTGNASVNIITGGNGDDLLIGGAGADQLLGGLGNDTYVVSDSGAVITEVTGGGVDLVQVSAAAYTLGAEVENMLYTGFGNFAGTGNAAANTLTGGAGNDTLDGLGGADLLVGDLGNDTLRGGLGDDILYGNEGADTLDGGAGADTMVGGVGDDTYIVDNAGDTVTELANEGVDSVQTSLASYTLGLYLQNLAYTGSGAFAGTGNEQSNQIQGGSGNDTLDGGAGVDVLIGGLGNDTYVVDEALDGVIELAGQGTDLVRTGLASYALFANVENLTFTGTGMFVASGNALANVITGGASGDVLDGDAGADTLIGLAGDDTYVVDNAGDVVVEAVGAGIDVVHATVLTHTLAANVENLLYLGAGNFTGTGNALANTLTGGAGNDTLNGAAGSDTLIGDNGNDIYVVDNSGDVVVELAGAGTGVDLVRTTLLNYTLGANLENLAFIGAGNFAGTGNADANALTGGAGSDTLNGLGGADTLAGLGGNDTYLVDSSADVVVEAAAAGTDQVQSTAASYTLSANVENLAFTGTGNFAGTGNASANLITGGAGNDTLNGLGGVDTLTGLGGNDTYLVDATADIVVEAVGAGIDRVLSTAASYTLSANVENLTFTGTAGNFNGTGNALANIITGGAGTDTINGGLGIDTMIGGNANDFYTVDNSADVVIEAAGAAAGTNDGIQSTALSYTLSANVETLNFIGVGNFIGIGNALSNSMRGGAGNDTLDGGIGTDLLIGFGGNDTYLVNVATDIVQEAAGAGTDTVLSTATAYTLSVNVENLTQTGAAAILTGNTLANVLTGGAGNDTLRGLDGDDRLIGGLGNDTLDGGTGNDVFVFNAAGFGTDTLIGFDADPLGGQDLLDLIGLGVTAGTFAARVHVTDLGANLQVVVDGGGTFVLQGVGDPTLLTSADFLLA